MLMKFRIIALLLMLAVCAAGMSGCKRTDYAENKAYVVVLGADYVDDNVKLTIRYPKLTGNTGSTGGGEGSSYGSASAVGATFQQALDALKIAMPNEMSLSALTMVIVSRDVIDSGKYTQIIEGIAANYRMYSSAYIAVCDGDAAGFLEKQEPMLGSRLSENLKALVENSGETGNIPVSRLADVYYRSNSVYSDPMIMRCYTEENGDAGGQDGQQDKSSGSRFAGAYVIYNNRNTLMLDAEQTMLVNVLKGDVKQFTYSDDEIAANLTADKRPKISISIDNGLKISVEMDLSGMLMSSGGDMKKAADAIREELIEIIDYCKRAGVEPFGFADIAAGKFLTMDDWIGYRWNDRFQESEIEIDIQIREVF